MRVYEFVRFCVRARMCVHVCAGMCVSISVSLGSVRESVGVRSKRGAGLSLSAHSGRVFVKCPAREMAGLFRLLRTKPALFLTQRVGGLGVCVNARVRQASGGGGNYHVFHSVWLPPRSPFRLDALPAPPFESDLYPSQAGGMGAINQAKARTVGG